jgi:hypothetical protein
MTLAELEEKGNEGSRTRNILFPQHSCSRFNSSGRRESPVSGAGERARRKASEIGVLALVSTPVNSS